MYEAEQLNLGRLVAIKVLRSDKVGDASQGAERLEREARVMTRVEHPHIVKLHDVGQLPGGGIYLVMQLVSGLPLDVLIDQEGPLCPRRAWMFACQLLSALAEAHGAGVIHRDLKPENVLVSRRASGEDHVTVLDFGIAKSAGRDADPSLTRTGCFVGSPRYASPEQALGQPLSARTDLYGFGLLVYEMLTGHGPFSTSSPMELVMAHVERPAPWPTSQGIALRGALVDLVMACLSKSPDERPPSARAALKLLLASGVPEPRSSSAPRRRRRNAVRSGSVVPPPLPAAARRQTRPPPSAGVTPIAPIAPLAPIEPPLQSVPVPTRSEDPAAATLVGLAGLDAPRTLAGPRRPAAPRRIATARLPKQPPSGTPTPAPRRRTVILSAAIAAWLGIVATAVIVTASLV